MKKIYFALQRTEDQNLNYYFISSIGLTGEFHDCLGDQKISQKTGSPKAKLGDLRGPGLTCTPAK